MRITGSPNPKAPGVAVGVTEPMIEKLVHTFYARVRRDPLIGPIFNAAIADWDTHLVKLCDFWSSVTLMTGRYKGTPMRVHAELPGISHEHFARWLALFQATALTTCPAEAAQLFIDRSQPHCRIAAAGHRLASGRKYRSGTSWGKVRRKLQGLTVCRVVPQ